MGFEPTPTFVDQKTLYPNVKGEDALESGALDRSAKLTMLMPGVMVSDENVCYKKMITINENQFYFKLKNLKQKLIVYTKYNLNVLNWFRCFTRLTTIAAKHIFLYISIISN